MSVVSLNTGVNSIQSEKVTEELAQGGLPFSQILEQIC